MDLLESKQAKGKNPFSILVGPKDPYTSNIIQTEHVIFRKTYVYGCNNN